MHKGKSNSASRAKLSVFRLPVSRLPVSRLPAFRLPAFRMPVFGMPVFGLSLVMLWWLPVIMSMSAYAQPLTKTEEGQLYDEAVHILGGNANVVAKWVGEVRYAIVGDTTAGAAAMAKHTLLDVLGQTGLSGVLIDHGFTDSQDYLLAVRASPPFDLTACNTNGAGSRQKQCANFVVFIGTASTMAQLAEALPLRELYQKALQDKQSIHCFFAPSVSASMVIGRAFVYLRNDLSAEMQRTCLQEEIYQSFGLFNDFSNANYFSFNNVVEPKTITRYDRSLLQSLYQTSVTPGTAVFRVMKEWADSVGIDPFTR